MTEHDCYNSLLVLKLIANFENRGFEGYYCETKKDALNKALEIIPENALISYGGSATLYDIKI